MEREDRGNLFVLEGVLIALFLLGAAYTVQTFQGTSTEDSRPRTELGRLTRDMLVVLAGLDDGNGTSLLDRYLAESYHCRMDPVPSTTECDGARSKNLSIRIDHYLPLGAGYAIAVGNGFDSRELYRSPLPQGEAVAASLAFGTEWNLTFMATEFSCYDAGSDVNLTMLPIARSNLSWARYANVSVGAVNTSGEPASNARWWNVSLPAATRAASATIIANVTGNSSFPGATQYGSCAMAGLGPVLRDALREGTFSASKTTLPLGSSTTFTAELGAIAGLAGVSIDAVNVSIYEPLPPRGTTPDTWIELDRVTLSGGSTRTADWRVPGETLYGAHPVLLRVGVTVGATTLELRRVAVIQVALPTGEIPIDPPYRVSLQTWLADWS